MRADLLNQIGRSGALLAINLLFLIVWAVTGIGKLRTGVPSWFPEKFGETFLASFPGLATTFWMLTASELLGFGLAVVALARGEFLARKPAHCLSLMLMWSLFIFVQLSLGQWLTSEFNGTAQLFGYFAGTLVAFQVVASSNSRYA